MSDLNSDLFNRHLSDNIPCVCTSPEEDANHYLLNCPLYENVRKLTHNVFKHSWVEMFYSHILSILIYFLQFKNL